MTVNKIIALNAVTATTVSDKIWVGDFDRVAILFRRADNAGGTSAFTVKAGFDDKATGDPTMTAYNMLVDNVTNTNAQTLTRVNGKSIANANGDAMVWVDPSCPVSHLEITVTETSDGTHSAFIFGFKEE